jgi:hypothetical protein
MKIRVLSIILLIGLLLTACQSSGVAAGISYNGLPAITPELKQEIETVFLNKGMEQIEWEEFEYLGVNLVHETIRYYGNYGDWSVFFANWGISGAGIGETKVGGVFFEYGNGLDVWAYKDGELLKLDEAYEKGHITVEDLQAIADLHIQRELSWELKRCQIHDEKYPDEPPREIPDWLKPYQK